MTTRYRRSNGEVLLSRWWRTDSARAAFTRVKKERDKRRKELKRKRKEKSCQRIIKTRYRPS